MQFTEFGRQNTIQGPDDSGLNDFLFRRYSSTQSRWISPDPAGIAAVDPTNPQTWNRYAYVANNPLSATDPLGLYEGNCDPNDPDCYSCVYDVVFCEPLGGSGGGSGGGGGGDGTGGLPPAAPAGPAPGPLRRNANWSTETLGLPGGLHLQPLSLANLLGLSPGTECDFGVCAPIGGNFIPAAAAGGTLICQFAEPCGLIEDAVLVTAVAVVGIAAIHQLAKGRTNVGHDYVRDEARSLAKELGVSYCEALQMIYDAARAAGNSKKANDTKATQKQDGCRGH